MITTVNKVTGEQIDMPTDTFEQVVLGYRQAQEYERISKELKKQLKTSLSQFLDESGRSQVSSDGMQFKQIESQRMTYSKSALRKVFDDDTIDLFTKVSKGTVDAYIKESDLDAHQRAELKAGLEPDGAVTTSIRLEKVA